jgi:DNA-binding transcriptional MerR regulator
MSWACCGPRVDPATGYRYCTANQVPRLNRLIALKDLGFSLAQIAGFLNDDLSPEEIRGMLKLRHPH